MLKGELANLLIALTLAIPITYILYRLHLPSLVGFILIGFIVGPSVLSLIKDFHTLENFAEIGTIFLMFLLGLEITLK